VGQCVGLQRCNAIQLSSPPPCKVRPCQVEVDQRQVTMHWHILSHALLLQSMHGIWWGSNARQLCQQWRMILGRLHYPDHDFDFCGAAGLPCIGTYYRMRCCCNPFVHETSSLSSTPAWSTSMLSQGYHAMAILLSPAVAAIHGRWWGKEEDVLLASLHGTRFATTAHRRNEEWSPGVSASNVVLGSWVIRCKHLTISSYIRCQHVYMHTYTILLQVLYCAIFEIFDSMFHFQQ